jgi:cytochrome c556
MKTRMKVSMTGAATVFMLAACSGGGSSSRSADAVRQPTFKEREAITAAMPAWLRRYPIG